jgi:hypothetical protein
VSFLLAEQNTSVALRYADFGYILENGRVVMEGAASELASNEDVKEFYLGVSGAGRKSFRDMKFYRRRKRWLALTKDSNMNIKKQQSLVPQLCRRHRRHQVGRRPRLLGR